MSTTCQQNKNNHNNNDENNNNHTNTDNYNHTNHTNVDQKVRQDLSSGTTEFFLEDGRTSSRVRQDLFSGTTNFFSALTKRHDACRAGARRAALAHYNYFAHMPN